MIGTGICGADVGTGTSCWSTDVGTVGGEMVRDRDRLWARGCCVFCCFLCFLFSIPHSAVTFPLESKLINVTFSSLFLLRVMHPPPVPQAAALASVTTAIAPPAPRSLISPHWLPISHSLNQSTWRSERKSGARLPARYCGGEQRREALSRSLSSSGLQSRDGAGTGTLKSLTDRARVNQPCMPSTVMRRQD